MSIIIVMSEFIHKNKETSLFNAFDKKGFFFKFSSNVILRYILHFTHASFVCCYIFYLSIGTMYTIIHYTVYWYMFQFCDNAINTTLKFYTTIGVYVIVLIGES